MQLGERSGQRDGLFDVELCQERVMRKHGRGHQPTDPDDANGQRSHRSSLLSVRGDELWIAGYTPGLLSSKPGTPLVRRRAKLKAIHLPHAALANEGGDVAVAESRADFKGHDSERC